MILQDSAWFCKILQNSAAFCKIYEKFEAFIPKFFVKKLPKIEANFTNFEVWCSKTELPKIEITNIEGYQYRGIPVDDFQFVQSDNEILIRLDLKNKNSHGAYIKDFVNQKSSK